MTGGSRYGAGQCAGATRRQRIQGVRVLELIGFVNRHAKGPKATIVITSIVSGVSRGLVLTTISTAAASLLHGSVDPLLVLAFCSLVLLHLGADYYRQSRTNGLVRRMEQGLRLRTCARLMRTQLRFVEEQTRGEIFARLSVDIHMVAGFATISMRAVEHGLLLLVCLAYMGYLSLQGLGAALIAIVAGVGVYLAQEREGSANMRIARRKQAEFFEEMNGLLHAFKQLKINQAKKTDALRDLDVVSRAHRDAELRSDDLFLKSELTARAFTLVLIAVIIFVLPWLTPADNIVVFQFVAAILFMLGPFEMLIGSIPSMLKARVCYQNLMRLDEGIEAYSSLAESTPQSAAPLTFERISLRGVCFQYRMPPAGESFGIGPVDLDINRGEVLFIVGGNGSGKTTLLKVLTHLYKPSAGETLVDGRALDQSTEQPYREMFTTIFGEFHLYRKLHGIRDPDPQRIETLLGELALSGRIRFTDGRFSSTELSTGQRKRLAYLVSELEDRQIYVFDEFSAEQDPEFRRYVYRALIPALRERGKTVIAVTHDDRYFDACDRLVKMDFGRLVEQPVPGGMPAHRLPDDDASAGQG